MARIQIIGLLASITIISIVLEQVRRRRMALEYSLIWILASGSMLVISLWRQSIEYAARLMGIVYSPSAVFVVFGVIIIVICIHFSLVISKLSQSNRVLVQRLALLESEVKDISRMEPRKQVSTNDGRRILDLE